MKTLGAGLSATSLALVAAVALVMQGERAAVAEPQPPRGGASAPLARDVVHAPAAAGEPLAAAVADFDGDGVPDLALAAGGAEPIEVFAGRAVGGFRTTPVRRLAAPGVVALATVRSAEGEADGLAVLERAGRRLRALRGGRGGLAEAGAHELPFPATSVVAAPLDGDPHPDLALAMPSAGLVRLLRGRGDGGFEPGRDLRIPGRPELLAAGSGGPAGAWLAVLDRQAATVRLIAPDARGRLGPRRAFPTGAALPNGLVLGDLSGDGRPDLAVTHDDGTVALFLGRRSGGLRPLPTVRLESRALSPLLGDFLGRGRPQLAVLLPAAEAALVLPYRDRGRGFALRRAPLVPTRTRPALLLATRASLRFAAPDSLVVTYGAPAEDPAAGPEPEPSGSPAAAAPDGPPAAPEPAAAAPEVRAGPGRLQTVTLTSLSISSAKEGDDFFTRDLNDPLDFGEADPLEARRDFGWEERFSETGDTSTIGTAGGIWKGTALSGTPGANAFVLPLFPGFGNLPAIGQPPGPTGLALNLGKVGENFPVLDPNKHHVLAVRSRVNSRSNWAVSWRHEVDWPVGDERCGDSDGYFTNQFVPFGTTRWVLYLLNLKDFVNLGLGAAQPPSCTGNWEDGGVRALQIESSAGSPGGTVFEYDWIRLVDPASAPNLTVSWTTSGAPAGARVNVFVDNDNAGFDGAFLARVAASANAFTLPSAALPPGDWYFYLELMNNTGSDTLLNRSAYSGKFTVNGKTTIEFRDPSWTSGPDYATEVVKNPWDMNDAADIVNLTHPLRDFINHSFSGGAFTATAIKRPENPHSDSQLLMNISQTQPIDTRRYRFLTWEMEIDPSSTGTTYTNISDKVARGWLSRAIWWNTAIQTDGSEIKGSAVFEGRQAYSADLAAANVLSLDNPFPSQLGWRGSPTYRGLRIDPTETGPDTEFTIYDVKLTGRPEPAADGNFTIRVTTRDPEGDTATVDLFRRPTTVADENDPWEDDSPPQPPCTGTLLGTLSSVAPGDHNLVINTLGFSPRAGEWQICAKVTDTAGNVFERYADVPLFDGPRTWSGFFAVDPRETPFVGDFDGDTLTDIITFTRDNPLAVGDVYVSRSDGTKFGTPSKWHDFFAIDSGEKVIIGDYDGDGDDDIATWLGPERALGATFQVYVARSFGTGMCGSNLWLSSFGNSIEDRIFSGDVDNDGDDDLILFDRSSVNGFGKVFVARSNGQVGICDESTDPSPGSFSAPEEWQSFFAVSTFERPLVGDVDGDGCTDIITFATDSPTAFGDVYVARSNCTSRFAIVPAKWHDFFGINPAELLRIGRFGTDLRDDFFTFLPQTGGQVYVSESQGTAMGPNLLYAGEGFAPSTTDRIFVGDVNGDNKVDIIHFQQSVGRVWVLLTS